MYTDFPPCKMYALCGLTWVGWLVAWLASIGGGQPPPGTTPFFHFCVSDVPHVPVPRSKSAVKRVIVVQSYPKLIARLIAFPQRNEKVLTTAFLRDELRFLLKANRVSYHKPGPRVRHRAFVCVSVFCFCFLSLEKQFVRHQTALNSRSAASV
jgi:hypothetical protein